jgi:ABC-2 type transport system permease protein
MLRSYTRERGRLVGVIIALLFLGPLVIAAAVGSALGYLRLPPPWPAQLLGVVLVFLWFIWLVFPIFFSTLNEAADITRLLIYPLPQRDLIAAVLLGTLFDYPTYLMLPMLLAVLVGWGASLALPVVIIAILLCYAHMVFIGLLVGTALGGVLQSRRFRDVAIIFTALLGSSCYFLQVGLGRLIENVAKTMSQEELLALQPLPVLQWFPTGAAAQAIAQAADGQWAAALGWLLYSSIWLLLIVWAWWKLLIRLTTGEGFLFALAPRPQTKSRAAQARATSLPIWLRRLPPDIAHIMHKEFKEVWRTPQRRVGLIQGLLVPVFMGGFILFRSEASLSSVTTADFIGLGLPLYAFFIYWVTAFNMLGWEGKGLPILFLTPIPRHRIFLGKGVALYCVASLPFLLVGVIIVVILADWVSLGGLLTGLIGGFTTIGVTAVFATLFPSPVDKESRRRRSSFSMRGGCLPALANLLLLVPLIFLLAVPSAIPLAIAYFFDLPWVVFVSLPLTTAYALLIFWLGCRLSGNLLSTREPEVLAATRIET